MKKLAIFAMSAMIIGCTSMGTTTQKSTINSTEYGNYSGKGGMTAYAIDDNAYKYHYDYGFTGIDAMGWDSNLQFAWSRIAAAKTCNIPVDSKKIIPLLVKKYGHDSIVHELNGVDFHFMQQKSIKNFCNDKRMAELKIVIPQMANDQFVQKF